MWLTTPRSIDIILAGNKMVLWIALKYSHRMNILMWESNQTKFVLWTSTHRDLWTTQTWPKFALTNNSWIDSFCFCSCMMFATNMEIWSYYIAITTAGPTLLSKSAPNFGIIFSFLFYCAWCDGGGDDVHGFGQFLPIHFGVYVFHHCFQVACQ
jgi:hypothetical protein